jgi:hypothetical protein
MFNQLIENKSLMSKHRFIELKQRWFLPIPTAQSKR